MALVCLRRAGEISEGKEKTGQDANAHDPNAFEKRMPESAEVELLESLGVVRSQIGHNRFLRIRRNRCAERRLRMINHGRIPGATIHQQARRKRRMARKVLWLKNAFPDGNCITRFDAKTSAVILIEL